MNRRNFIKASGLSLLGINLSTASTVFGAGNSTSNNNKPNIVFIFSDDHAIQAIGAYPSRLKDFIKKNNLTPNIDSLADEGGIFINSFCGNSICGPSRSTILTGKHSHKNGFKQNGDTFDGSQWTFPKEMRKAGYQTAIVGKWHLKSDPTGFDHWDVLPGQGFYYNPDFKTANGPTKSHGYTTDIITDKTIEWLDSRDSNKPFMLMCQHKAPHRSWLPSLKYLNLLDDVTVPEPETLFDDYSNRTSSASENEMTISEHIWIKNDLKLTKPLYGRGDDVPYDFRPMTDQQRKEWDKAYVPKNEAFKKKKLTGKELLRWKYQRYVKEYLRCIKSVDDNVGRVNKYLEDNDLKDNTIIIYCSDQGFYLGEHGWFDKRWMYEESLRMPFIIRWPGTIKSGTVYDEFIQNIDYAPTFLDIASGRTPKDVQGRSLVPVIKQEKDSNWRKSIYYHYYEHPGYHNVRKHYGIRTERYKLMHFYEVDEWEFYDLDKDPNEINSVYLDPRYSDTVRQIKQELKALQDKYDVPQEQR